MYLVYADGELMHDPRLEDERYLLIDPVLSLNLDEAGTFNFTMTPNHAMYDSLEKMSTIVTVTDGKSTLFRGRVLQDDKDFYNNKQVSCEGMYAFLMDSIVRPHSKTMQLEAYIAWLIQNHNSQTDAYKHFYPGVVNVEGTYSENTFEVEDYTSTYDRFSSLVDEYGGYFLARETDGLYYLDFLVDAGDIADQTIEFGVNLLDVTKTIDASNIFTVLIPTGGVPDNSEDNKSIDIKSVNGGKDYIENGTGISWFGRIVQHHEWSDIKDPSELLEVARDYLNSSIYMAVSLEIGAVDLGLIDSTCGSIKLGDFVRVKSEPHGIDEYFTCTGIEYDLISPENTKYTFGANESDLLSEQTAKTSDSIYNEITNLNTAIQQGNSYSSATYVHQAELNDAINRLTNSDIDSICAS